MQPAPAMNRTVRAKSGNLLFFAAAVVLLCCAVPTIHQLQPRLTRTEVLAFENASVLLQTLQQPCALHFSMVTTSLNASADAAFNASDFCSQWTT